VSVFRENPVKQMPDSFGNNRVLSGALLISIDFRSCRTIEFAINCFETMIYNKVEFACFLFLCRIIFQKTPAFSGFGKNQSLILQKRDGDQILFT